MYTNLTIAKRLYTKRTSVRVAFLGMVVSVLVMIVTLAIVIGFKDAIRNKVSGFGAHIQVVNFDNNNTYELKPIRYTDSLLLKIASVDGVASVRPFATKPGMLKTNDAFQAVVFKGHKKEETRRKKQETRNMKRQDFFADNLVAGRMPQKANEVVISRELGRLLRLDIDSTFFCYFIQEQIRARRFTVSGLYNTDFTEYDKMFIVGDMVQVQQLNGWDSTQVSGIDVMIRDFADLDEVTNRVYFRTANQEDSDGNFLYTQNIQQINPAIFSWLDLLDMNVIVIIVLMLAVAGICMCSGLIILILEGIQFIGLMKALGATNMRIRKIYLWQAAFIIGRGMLFGNILGITLCAIQYFFHLIPLDASAYYVSYVPIAFTWLGWLLLNIGTFAVSMLIMLLPSVVVTKISPAQVMRYE